ncbi:hypothetical protein HETIRDRAFT_452833 [Heterobasidion irregulare TC 32-1]|uniref:Uncharacterized protein n=1 Tax=Heterobasidion irregulare (strain TC 32-1) TaxID=747525 RepID=W4K1X3_HETIT|nr:uncharacterized protein HETIRDRAFT_452833 [Heterobasidion irregulare TC 32-1]ETW79739.1 hypothetical protein HETIRDRAFT_452833 [Heterobasidion irregulare TC 32-1]
MSALKHEGCAPSNDPTMREPEFNGNRYAMEFFIQDNCLAVYWSLRAYNPMPLQLKRPMARTISNNAEVVKNGRYADAMLREPSG